MGRGSVGGSRSGVGTVGVLVGSDIVRPVPATPRRGSAPSPWLGVAVAAAGPLRPPGSQVGWLVLGSTSRPGRSARAGFAPTGMNGESQPIAHGPRSEWIDSGASGSRRMTSTRTSAVIERAGGDAGLAGEAAGRDLRGPVGDVVGGDPGAQQQPHRLPDPRRTGPQEQRAGAGEVDHPALDQRLAQPVAGHHRGRAADQVATSPRQPGQQRRRRTTQTVIVAGRDRWARRVNPPTGTRRSR